MSGGTSRDSGEGRRRKSPLRWALAAVLVIAAFGIGLLLRHLESDDGSPSSAASLAGQPPQGATGALEAARDDLSPEAELAMVDAAVENQLVESVVETGGDVTAALVLETELVTAGDDGSVEVWDRDEGTPLAETQVGSPIELLAEGLSSSSVAAAVDRSGQLALVDLSDPGRLRVLPLPARLKAGETPLALAFSEDPGEIVAVGSGGEVLRADATTGAPLSRSNLGEMRGDLPWKGTAHPDLTAARFVPEVFEDEEGLLVGLTDGAVADIDLVRGQGKTVLDPGIAPGRILSLDRIPYGETVLAVGTTGGVVTMGEEDGEPNPLPGPAVTGVVAELEGGIWAGGKEGVSFGPYFQPPDSGPAVLGFEVSHDGIAAIGSGGRVSVLGRPGVGLSLEETASTPVAAFDSRDRLLIAEGFDANHVEELHAVRPKPPLPGDEYQEEDVVETYRPGEDWWPGAEDAESTYDEAPALYLNDVVGDEEFVAAGGQDPNGDAAVMVWEAKSGKPLQHLPLGTGGVETELPSIISEVVLLPGKDELAAYSVTQELLAIWSTETWDLVDSIPVGPAGDIALSPDEDTIVVVGVELEEGEEEDYDETDNLTELTFVDVDSGQVTDEVPTHRVTEAAFSPDGSILALGDESGYLRLLSSDGRKPAGPLVQLRGIADALAWRPDGELIAVSLAQGVVLVDPASGEVSEPLPPHDEYVPALGLAWSSDGSMLATLNPTEDEEGEGYDPGPTMIWTLGAAALERRMCELSACRSDEEPAGSRVDASQLSSVDLAYRKEGDLFAADLDGKAAWIGRMDEFSTPPASYDWSEDGFAWSAPGRIGILLDGEEKARFWPCVCGGVAWSGGEVVTLEANGKNLVRIDPQRQGLRATSVRGLPPFLPTLLGVVGGSPILAAYASEPDRSTPSMLFQVRPDGRVKKLSGDAQGSIYRTWPSSSPRRLAFVANLSGGACYSFDQVGVLSQAAGGRLELGFPPSPLGEEEPSSVRSLQVAGDGTVTATIGGIGCNDDGRPLDKEPPARRYRLEGGRLMPTGEEGYDVQAVAGTPVVEESEGFSLPGTLLAGVGEDSREIASEIEGVVARP